MKNSSLVVETMKMLPYILLEECKLDRKNLVKVLSYPTRFLDCFFMYPGFSICINIMDDVITIRYVTYTGGNHRIPVFAIHIDLIENTFNFWHREKFLLRYVANHESSYGNVSTLDYPRTISGTASLFIDHKIWEPYFKSAQQYCDLTYLILLDWDTLIKKTEKILAGNNGI